MPSGISLRCPYLPLTYVQLPWAVTQWPDPRDSRDFCSDEAASSHENTPCLANPVILYVFKAELCASVKCVPAHFPKTVSEHPQGFQRMLKYQKPTCREDFSEPRSLQGNGVKRSVERTCKASSVSIAGTFKTVVKPHLPLNRSSASSQFSTWILAD